MKACKHKSLGQNWHHKTPIMQPMHVMLFNDAWDVKKKKKQKLNMFNILK